MFSRLIVQTLKPISCHVGLDDCMKVVADLHIHGKYSRATSEQMSIPEIARFAKIKGLGLVGTGDFTHPKWLSELKETLLLDADTGLFKLATAASQVRFMVQTEVCTIFDFGGESKKIHHVILTPNLETAEQINVRLQSFGSLSSDGRPILSMTASQLVEEVMEVSSQNMVFPAHAWTPWFSIFGAFSGFNTVQDCYQDMTKHIHALETGLSSDPPMNWRLSKLDRFALVSNSDCHSFWPWRIGREANVFELEKLTYSQVIDAIKKNDSSKFKSTIETDPAYGKYHWTGHRTCKVALSPQEAKKFGNICPVCRRPLTKGVEQRVEELSDRGAGYMRPNAPGFLRLLPLSEIIATVIGSGSPSTAAVWKNYNLLIDKFGSEYDVLIDAPLEGMAQVVDPSIAKAVVMVRDGTAKVTPGYDGLYGRMILGVESPQNVKPKPKLAQPKVKQKSMSDFW